jgi:hypothetical protein
MAIYKYWLRQNGQSLEDAYTVDSEYRQAKDIASDAAENYHYKRGGLDAQWPVTITVELQNGTHRTFEVDREAQPVFFAFEV